MKIFKIKTIEDLYKRFGSKKDALKYYQRLLDDNTISSSDFSEYKNLIDQSDKTKYAGYSTRIFVTVGLITVLLIGGATAYFIIKDNKGNSSTEPEVKLVSVSNPNINISKNGTIVSEPLECFTDYLANISFSLVNDNSEALESLVAFKLYSILIEDKTGYQGIEYADFNKSSSTVTTYDSAVVVNANTTKDISYVVPFQPSGTSNVRFVVSVDNKEIINQLYTATL